MKSKEGGQGLYRDAVDHIKIFDNDDPGHKNCSKENTFINVKIFNCDR